MYHAEENYLAATCEMLSLNIYTQLRRVTDMPDELLTTLERVRKSHGQLPTPEVYRKFHLDREYDSLNLH